jgi:hypothetical protein
MAKHIRIMTQTSPLRVRVSHLPDVQKRAAKSKSKASTRARKPTLAEAIARLRRATDDFQRRQRLNPDDIEHERDLCSILDRLRRGLRNASAKLPKNPSGSRRR